jgi:hypothetical protein
MPVIPTENLFQREVVFANFSVPHRKVTYTVGEAIGTLHRLWNPER